MPHLVIDFSANLTDFPEAQILKDVNAALCKSPEIKDEADVKSRTNRIAHFEIGNQPANRGFVHAQLRLLAGRSPETKKDLAERIAVVLRKHTPHPAGMLVQLSVEILDMDRASYVKERL
ncbi:5-carboxymethyl-2-hydroxymuconate Delta-isomerase [Diaphorobacter aerolatus]|uniref:5-carboxymethyl-2-hydroxymuconate Delta-isomerase n=1 Tax=Diaphorobacter aerolatus TaxID=1288495 RepID=A0A7H0GHU8_9BURK|nr:5-carboxymethyl-2-hydroxymuconate Delta-isomerase [Diaphorobacter aerolatus]QNP47864.1 5-carboxymethyl-2-hydroxymuconate Delta-isomerase [Diaphorobacter aerolatus]